MTALVTKHLPLVASAPDGIKKLRELILELGVRGRLLPLELDPDSRIPIGWIKCALGDVLTFEYGKALPEKLRSNTGEYPVFGSNGVVGTHNVCHVQEPCIVIGRKGSAGALNLHLKSGCCVTDVAYYCIPGSQFLLEYLFILLNTLGLNELGKGIKPGLNRNEAYRLDILIPPLAEQGRIVAKVDELMALCDKLEADQADAEAAHAQLVQALLESLTQAKDADDFQESWRRLSENFHTLFTTEESINALKQAILQLGVMGKLTEQVLSDDSADLLVSEITTIREALIKNEGLRTSAQLTVEASDQYMKLPQNWCFYRLGNIAKFIDYRGRTPVKTTGGLPLITAKNVRAGFISRTPTEFIAEKDYKSWMTRGIPRVGDLLFTTEAPLGNVAEIDITEPFALAQRVICFQLHTQKIGPFLRLALMSNIVQERISAMASGMTATGIKSSKLKELPIPIPPLAEQHRIVAKVDELMALCDRLKANLTDARQQHSQLASVLVEEATA